MMTLDTRSRRTAVSKRITPKMNRQSAEARKETMRRKKTRDQSVPERPPLRDVGLLQRLRSAMDPTAPALPPDSRSRPCPNCGAALGTGIDLRGMRPRSERTGRPSAVGGAELGGGGAPGPRVLRDARARRDGVPRDDRHSRRVPLLGDLVSHRAAQQDEGDRTGDRPRPAPGGHRGLASTRRADAPAGGHVGVGRPGTRRTGPISTRSSEPVPPNHPIPLSDGDKIHVGAWTTVTMERLDAAPGRVTPTSTAAPRRTPGTWRGRTGAVEIDLLGPLRSRLGGGDPDRRRRRAGPC